MAFGTLVPLNRHWKLSGASPFAPGKEKPMSTWVVVASDAIADDPELIEWLRRGLRAVR